MKEKMITAINQAITDGTTVEITLETRDFNAMTVLVTPDGVDEGREQLTLFAGEDIYVFDMEHVEFDEYEEEYCCIGDSSVMSIKF